MSVSVKKTGIVSSSGIIGTNLVVGTQSSTYEGGGSGSRSRGKLGVGSGGNGTFQIVEDYIVPIGKYSYNILNNTSGNRDYQCDQIPYISGQTYTGSWWAKGSGTCLYRSWDITTSSQPMSKTFTLTADWQYYTHTFTATSAMETDNCTFHLGVTGTSSIYICGMKLEEGTIATPWCPAPEDEYSVGSTIGFNEIDSTKASIAKEYINATDFIEI